MFWPSWQLMLAQNWNCLFHCYKLMFILQVRKDKLRTLHYLCHVVRMLGCLHWLVYHCCYRDLDMSAYSIGEPTSSSRSPVYELYGVINHHGGLLGGHYTAYARCPDAKLNGTVSPLRSCLDWGQGLVSIPFNQFQFPLQFIAIPFIQFHFTFLKLNFFKFQFNFFQFNFFQFHL